MRAYQSSHIQGQHNHRYPLLELIHESRHLAVQLLQDQNQKAWPYNPEDHKTTSIGEQEQKIY